MDLHLGAAHGGGHQATVPLPDLTVDAEQPLTRNSGQLSHHFIAFKDPCGIHEYAFDQRWIVQNDEPCASHPIADDVAVLRLQVGQEFDRVLLKSVD
jgi:hypothetical protein